MHRLRPNTTPGPAAALQQSITHLSKDLSLKCCVVYYFFPKKGWSHSFYFKLSGGQGGGHRVLWARVSDESLVRSSLELFPFSWSVKGRYSPLVQCRAAIPFCDQERKAKLTELRILAPFPALLGNLALASRHKDLEQEKNLFLPSFPPQQRPTCSSMAWRWVSAGWPWISTVTRPLQRQLHLLLHPRTTELGRYSTLSTEILGHVLVFCSNFYPCHIQFPSLPLSSWCLSSNRLILFKGFPV